MPYKTMQTKQMIPPTTTISSSEKGIQETINDRTEETLGYMAREYHSPILTENLAAMTKARSDSRTICLTLIFN